MLASNNPGKLSEYRALLKAAGFEVVAPAELNLALEVEEEGATFMENARLKALTFSGQTELPVLADDSGLDVDSLGGLPGVRSRRFGPLDSDEARLAHLLERMRSSGESTRTARFHCALVLAQGGAVRFETERVCEGSIAPAPRGHAGFGFDPVFVPEGHERTFAELGDHGKNRISHRALAAADLIRFLPRLRE